jgi:glycerol kinase
LESIAYQVADLMDAVETDTNTHLPELRVDGGASANDSLMQFQADILGVPVVRPSMTETTALGAAFLAGLGAGFWREVQAISDLPREERRFEPRLPRSHVDAMRQRWNEAISRAKSWEQVLE